MRLLLVDGDELLWRVAVGPVQRAQLAGELERRISRLLIALRADAAVFALAGRGNWRRALWPAYKAHRRVRPRPPLLAEARRALEANWRTHSAPLLEADDVLGLAATDAGYLQPGADAGPGSVPIAPEPPGVAALRAERDDAAPAARSATGPGDGVERVIVSRDKDLLTVPGLHGRANGEIRRVEPEQAALAHLSLALTGDAADGYKGCPGIGPVKASRLLQNAPPCAAARWRAVAAAFRSVGLDEAEALLQARLARVLQAGDLDQAGRPRLWTPPGRR